MPICTNDLSHCDICTNLSKDDPSSSVCNELTNQTSEKSTESNALTNRNQDGANDSLASPASCVLTSSQVHTSSHSVNTDVSDKSTPTQSFSCGNSPTKPIVLSTTSMKGVDVYVNYNCGIFRQPSSASFGNTFNEITGKHRNVKLHAGVTSDDMPSLFRSISEMLPNKLACESNQQGDTGYPYYLQVLVNMSKQNQLNDDINVEYKIQYMECWMTIPHKKVDDLYGFFNCHYPDLYGELNIKQLSETPRRFVALNKMSSPLLSMSASPCVDHLESRINKEWEIVSIDEIMRRKSYLDIEKYLPLPILSNCSKVLNETIIKQLVGCLPARCEGFLWTQVFSTEANGYTLSTLYRQMGDLDSPVLMIVKDTEDNVFGSYLSDPLKHQERFHGTGECFLFSCTDGFKVYSWTGCDNFHISTFTDCLIIGGSRTGCAGLWLDADLYHGHTQKCDTYNNEPLTGGPKDFIVQEVEVWAFMEPEEFTMASSMEI